LIKFYNFRSNAQNLIKNTPPSQEKYPVARSPLSNLRDRSHPSSSPRISRPIRHSKSPPLPKSQSVSIESFTKSKIETKKKVGLEDIFSYINSGLQKIKSGKYMEHLQSQFSLLQTENQPDPKVFITKWIDYTTKYGLAYQLKDGTVGVYFNDGTSITLAPDGM
jgi:hypothetical protein